MLIILVGAFLVIGGILVVAREALYRGRLSGASQSDATSPQATLEPPTRGTRFLGISANWPGIAMMVVGAALLLVAPSF